jgi:hypothetical protein
MAGDLHMESKDLQADPIAQRAAEMGLDLLDFCLEELEAGDADKGKENEDDMNDDEFQVSGQNRSMEMYSPVYRLQFAETEADQMLMEQPEACMNSEAAGADTTEIEAASQWLDINDDDSPKISKDIIEIVKTCLNEVKKLRTARSVKLMTQLPAITEYVKLCTQFRAHLKCKQPCLNASLAIARRMGKGSYFARQIRQDEAFVRRHHQLPPSQAAAQHGQYTLLDNENVLHAVRRYLAAQSLGTITPHLLCHHVNGVILPALNMTGERSTICERTAITWLRKLGYTCKDMKKAIYHDGHERPDVVKAQKKFLEEMGQYERWVKTFAGNCSPDS